jgi:mono/diheme cytochrome c family protein
MKYITKITVLFSVLMMFNFCLHAQVKHHRVIHHRYSLKAAIISGQKVYADNCLSCHQADGGGIPNMNPPLIKTKYIMGDKTRLIKIVLNGFNENVEINGNTYSNNMPSHDYLTDQQIADVLTYVRNSFGNKALHVTAAQVKAVRAANKKP